MISEENEKKGSIVRRFKTRSSVGAQVSQKDIDIALIDLVLAKLFNGGEKQSANLVKDILTPKNVKLTKGELERFWDVLRSTGLVNSVIGFGKHGDLNLSPQGFQLMAQFGGYAKFLKLREAQARAQQAGQAAQFILNAQQGQDGAQSDGAGQDAAAQNKAKPENQSNSPFKDKNLEK